MLEQIFQTDVFPRLAQTHLCERSQAPALGREGSLSAAVDRFACILAAGDLSEAVAYFEGVLAYGLPSVAQFETVISATAKRLGDLWDQDFCGSMDIVRGIGHLQFIVHRYCRGLHGRVGGPVWQRRILLAVFPGNKHTLGISLIQEHLASEGWAVETAQPQTVNDLVALVESNWFDAAGLSVWARCDMAEVADAIRTVRRQSRNDRLAILVGGQPFVGNPGVALDIGADATATDGRGVVGVLSRLEFGVPAFAPTAH
jgi:methanogenic corrinoid protein MtbC1